MEQQHQRTSSLFNEKYMNGMVSFCKSEIWHIIKYRLGEYQQNLTKNAMTSLQSSPTDQNARKHANMSEGVRNAIEITERLASEIDKGAFDVDAALGIIENKPETNGKVKESCLNKILAMVRKR